MLQKPYAPACERNQQPILNVLQSSFANVKNVLEVGSGTGQHAVYFAKHMPWLTWQCSDVAENLEGISLWVEEANLPNLLPPVELDVSVSNTGKQYDAVFSANTLHIISKQHVECFFDRMKQITLPDSELVIYGPFNYNGQFTSDSNAQFEIWLKQRDPLSGIRDFEWIDQLANTAGFNLVYDYEMPANNRCLHWHRM